MQKNLFQKISLGIATSLYLITPILLIGLWLITIPFFVLAEQQYYNDPSVLFFFVFFLFSLGAGFLGILHLVLMPVYMSLLLQNTKGSLLMRTMLGIGLLFLPCVAAAVYYLIYIVPSNPPEWAQDAKAASQPAAPVVVEVALSEGEPS